MAVADSATHLSLKVTLSSLKIKTSKAEMVFLGGGAI